MKEALKLALEALVEMSPSGPIGSEIWHKQMNAIRVAGDALAQPEQEPVAINQHRVPYCADWYDGIPDYHDGHGPYEVRTLYTTPPKRPWVGLTDAEMFELSEFRNAHGYVPTSAKRLFARIEAKLKEKNT